MYRHIFNIDKAKTCPLHRLALVEAIQLANDRGDQVGLLSTGTCEDLKIGLEKGIQESNSL